MKKQSPHLQRDPADQRLRVLATALSLFFVAFMLYPMIFAISSAMKDNTQIHDVPPKLLPDTAHSLSLVLDYSDSGSNEKQLKEDILQDSILCMMGLSHKMAKDSIMEIKVYGMKKNKTLFYSRAHQMKLQMEKDYGVYKGAAIKKEVLLHEDRYRRVAESIGYQYDPQGLSIQAPSGLEPTFEEKATAILGEKYPLHGKILQIGHCVKNLLHLESFRYYLEMPRYIYPESEQIQRFGFLTFVFNSIIVIGFAIVAQVFLCSICAFVISRKLSKRAGRLVLLFFLGAMMVPFASIMLPQLVMYRQMGAYNNYWALLLPFLYPFGFYVYLYKGFFDKIPASYFEAAELDGAGNIYLYRKICMPLSKPIISLIALQTFIGNWNDFFWAWLVTEDQQLWTLNVALFNISNHVATKQNALMGLAVITILPVMLLSILFSKQLKKSIMASGVKG